MSNSFAGKTFALFDHPSRRKLVAGIEKTGARILKFPSIEAEKSELSAESAELIKNLGNFDWIIFTDVLAVDFLLENLEANGIDHFELDDLRVCALGEVVSDRLRFVQLHADVIPNRIDAESVIASLKNYTVESEFSHLKFLVVKENSLDGDIGSALVKSGVEAVMELPIYHINAVPKDEIVKLKTLFINGAVDEFVFAAPTDFIALKHIFEAENLADLFSEIKVSAVDGQTLQIVRENNIKRADLFRSEKVDTV